MAPLLYCFPEGDTVRQHVIIDGVKVLLRDERSRLKATTGLTAAEMSSVCVYF